MLYSVELRSLKLSFASAKVVLFSKTAKYIRCFFRKKWEALLLLGEEGRGQRGGQTRRFGLPGGSRTEG